MFIYLCIFLLIKQNKCHKDIKTDRNSEKYMVLFAIGIFVEQIGGQNSSTTIRAKSTDNCPKSIQTDILREIDNTFVFLYNW